MNEDIDFDIQSKQILDKFISNVLKASIISELKKEHIEKSFEGDLAKTIEEMQTKIGIENIAMDQAIVMIASSFEAFMKDFFSLMILREDVLKNALRECKNLKANPLDLVDLLNNKISWADLIIDKENLSFQRFGSLCKISKMLRFSFEDILEDTAKEVDKYLKDESKNRVGLSLSGQQIFIALFDARHKIVHESLDMQIINIDFRNYLLFFEILSHFIRNKFFPTSVKVFIRKFNYESIPTGDNSSIPPKQLP